VAKANILTGRHTQCEIANRSPNGKHLVVWRDELSGDIFSGWLLFVFVYLCICVFAYLYLRLYLCHHPYYDSIMIIIMMIIIIGIIAH